MKKLFFAFLLFTFCSASATAEPLKWYDWTKTWINSFNALEVGDKAPNYLGVNEKGKPVTLEDFKGKTVFLNFWATWCPACQREFVELPEIQSAFPRDDFQVVTVNIYDSREDLDSYLQQHPTPLTVIFADKTVPESYRVHGIPANYLVDSDGVIINKWIGRQYLKTFKDAIKLHLGS